MAGECSSELKCLICATQISNFAKFTQSSDDSSLLGKHLKIVFLLRNILNISNEKLVKFLQGCSNVDEWISVCDNCETLVNQCNELYQKYEKSKQNILKIVKLSCSTSCYDRDNDSEEILDIFKEVRSDVNEREENYSEDVIAFGDLKAAELAVKLINPLKLDDESFIKEESEDDDDIQVDPLLEAISVKWNGNDGDDTEEDKPEVEDILEIEEDEDNCKSNLKEKRKYIRNRPPFKCPFCKIYSAPLFRSSTQIINHLENCKPNEHKLSNEQLTCFNCNQFKCPSNNIISFYHHTLLCSGGGSQSVPLSFRFFQCDVCPSSKTSKELFMFSKFIPHIILHKQFTSKCTQCNEPLRNSLESDKHWRKHHPLEYQAIPEDQRSSSLCHVCIQPALPSVPWWCPQCGCEFSTEDLRDLHVSTNHPSISKDNPCESCDKRYHCPKELQLHQIISHAPQTLNKKGNFKFHKCPLCPDVFTGVTGKVDLLTHQSRVHKISQFKCEQCTEEFLSYSALKQHRSSHQFDLKCADCGKTYFSKVTFDRHVAVKHNKTLAFTCDQCGKGLADGNSLKHHQRDRHGLSEKKFRCEVEGCGKGLRDLESFKAHMDRHSNCPEFKCEQCGQEFYTRGNLNRHSNTVHSDGSADVHFDCDECPFRTKFKYNLGVHKKSAHDPDKLKSVIKVKRRKINK